MNKKVMKTIIKKISKVLLLAITIFSISIISSCSPEDGKDGVNGTNGVDGINGTNGTNGTSSNVNVISTPWTTRTFSGSGTSWTVSFSVPQITASVLSSGLLLTYRKVDTGETVQVTNQVSPYFWIYYMVGTIEFDATTNQTAQYRHIIISSVTSAFSKKTQPNYSKMSYHEVCTLLDIQE